MVAGRAHSSRAIRSELSRRGIVAGVREPRDQQGHRTRLGLLGGRAVTCDPVAYRGRNTVERSFNVLVHWRGLATRSDGLDVANAKMGCTGVGRE